MNTPGRIALISQAAYDDRLDTARRLVHLRIALPAGFNEEAALKALQAAREQWRAGHATAAGQVIRGLIENPPMSGAQS